MRSKVNSPVRKSLIFFGFTFLFTLLLCKPILNSCDDLYFLYTLSGDSGTRPTALLHYNYTWNPIASWPICTLFKIYPGFNWYSFELLIIQFLSCLNIGFWAFKLLSNRRALLFLGIYFLFIQVVFLLSLNYSNTSFVAAISGGVGVLLYCLYKENNAATSSIVFSILLLITGGLLRFHVFLFCVVLVAWVGLFAMALKLYKRFLLSIALVLSLVGAAFLFQNYYYTNKIENWKSEEAQRQAIFFLANHPTAFPPGAAGVTGIKNSLIQNWLFYDTSFLRRGDIESYGKQNVFDRVTHPTGNGRTVYWIFQNNRVYLLLLALFVWVFLLERSWVNLKRWALMSSGPILILIYLFIFMKVTEAIQLVIFWFILFACLLCFNNLSRLNRVSIYSVMVLLPVCFLWIGIRIYTIDAENRESIQLSNCVLHNFKNHPEFLFVYTTPDYYDNPGYYAWNIPGNYPMQNVITKEQVITNSYTSILAKFQIQDLFRELPFKKQVVLLGKQPEFLKDYYRIKYNSNTTISTVDGLSCVTAYQISAIQ